LNGETNKARKRQNRAIITADVRRFDHVINTDGVLGTHSDYFSFLRCGVDHHTINLVETGSNKHFHTAFELRDWAHMQSACDFLSKNGYKILWGPGRHGIGHNLFTYHRGPNGLITELFAELDQMKDESLGYFDPKPWHRDYPQRPKTWPKTPDAANLWGPMPPDEMMQ
jgi:Glyoxalase/Bleomycin resistance protein/Dioxygenase superfamily